MSLALACGTFIIILIILFNSLVMEYADNGDVF
jgi:hypothetical protein